MQGAARAVPLVSFVIASLSLDGETSLSTPQLVHSVRPVVQRDRLLRLPDVEAVTGLKKSMIYLLMKRREFVPCVQLTTRCVAWPESRVLQWVQDRIAQVDQQSVAGHASDLASQGGAQ